MRTTRNIFCAILTIVFIFAASAGAYSEVVDLGVLDCNYPISCGQSIINTSYAWSINNDGQIVGWAENFLEDLRFPGAVFPLYERACLFDNTGGGANINLCSDGRISRGVFISFMSGALSSSGNRIVGLISYYDPNYCQPNSDPVYCGNYPYCGRQYYCDGPLYRRAYLFDPTGGGANKDLGTLGGINSCAHSVNTSGQIVGWAESNLGVPIGVKGPLYERACLFGSEDANNNKDIGTLGGYESEALSINDSNEIVGWADNSSSYEHACIFDFTGDSNNNVDLGTLGGNSSSAWSINNGGRIVGWSLDSSGNYHACLFNPTGGGANKDLGTLGGNGSEAYCINDDGEIVGYALDGSEQPRACLFDPTGNGNNIDLNTLIDPNSGWTLLYASGIDNEGWIVGQGVNSLGQTHAFLLLPPPPIRAKVFILPRVLNLQSCGKWITCYIQLPKGCKVTDINPASILLEDEIKAQRTMIPRWCQTMIVKFSRSEVEDIVSPGWNRLTVSGKLTNGRTFEGTDTIRVIGRPKYKWWWPIKCRRR
jgi:probable HAF family extracellular repeat protein